MNLTSKVERAVDRLLEEIRTALPGELVDAARSTRKRADDTPIGAPERDTLLALAGTLERRAKPPTNINTPWRNRVPKKKAGPA